MIILENIKDGINTLGINKTRVILPVLSILFGVASLVLISSVIEGEKRFILKEIEKMGSKLVSVSMRVSETEMSVGFTQKDTDAIIKRCAEVKQILPITSSSYPIYASNKSIDAAQVVGIAAELKEVTEIPLIMGRFFNQEEVNNLSNVCVIGEGIYHKLFKKIPPINQSIYLIGSANQKINLRIIGVFDKTNQQIQRMIDNEGIIVPITVFQKEIAGKSNIFSLLVETYNSAQVSKAVQDIKAIFELRKISVIVYAPKELLSAQFSINKKATIFGFCLGILLLIVGGVGIMNIMLKSIIERTKEIGIRKAVGAKNRHILTQFLTEAFIIGILGCGIGVFIGIIGTHFIAGSLIKTSTPVISLLTIFVSCGVALILTLLFALYPASRASSLNPIDALRYE
ncbi:MAG: ABC transporter permease [bacterium]